MKALRTPSRTHDNKSYMLTFDGGRPVSCTCPGFAYRNNCRHIREHTNGRFLVYCGGCMSDRLRAVTAEVGREYARTNRCCSGAPLYCAPDFDARKLTAATDLPLRGKPDHTPVASHNISADEPTSSRPCTLAR